MGGAIAMAFSLRRGPWQKEKTGNCYQICYVSFYFTVSAVFCCMVIFWVIYALSNKIWLEKICSCKYCDMLNVCDEFDCNDDGGVILIVIMMMIIMMMVMTVMMVIIMMIPIILLLHPREWQGDEGGW